MLNCGVAKEKHVKKENNFYVTENSSVCSNGNVCINLCICDKRNNFREQGKERVKIKKKKLYFVQKNILSIIEKVNI